VSLDAQLAALAQRVDAIEKGRLVTMSPSTPAREALGKQALLSPDEAAIVSGLSRRSMDRAIASGKLASTRVGSNRRISAEALDRYMRGLPADRSTAPKLRIIEPL
jgi:excisionase family DNA binding protein